MRSSEASHELRVRRPRRRAPSPQLGGRKEHQIAVGHGSSSDVQSQCRGTLTPVTALNLLARAFLRRYGHAHKAAAPSSIFCQKASAMSAVSSPPPEVQSGLEGVVAFATEIAEPDKEGGALRYRGVDIENLVGAVPYEQVWGLLVDGHFKPGLPPGRTARADRPLGRPPRRRAVGAGDARARVGLRAADRHLRRAGARQPRARLGDGAVVRGAVRARAGPAAGAPGARSTRATRSRSASSSAGAARPTPNT